MNRLHDKRVLHVGKFYPPHMGGMETHLRGLCEELQRHMHVDVLVANDSTHTSEETIGGVAVTRAGTLVNFAAAPICPEMPRRIRDANADLVHIHLPNPTAILAYQRSGHRGRLVFTYHSDIVRQRFLGRAFWPFLRRALTRASAIIVTSPNYRDSSPALSEFKDKCHVIPLGIPVERFDVVDEEVVADLRRRYGTRIVLGVGRMVYYKGFEYLLRAMKTIDAHLLLIGDGPLKNDLEHMASLLGISDRVTFLGDIKDVRPYYHAADVFALPSIARSEAFGIVQLEAMACGIPVVNTNIDSGVPFVSPHEISGLTVPVADTEALGKAITSLLDDPLRRQKLGKGGRNRVEQEFTLDAMTRKTLELYAKVLEVS